MACGCSQKKELAGSTLSSEVAAETPIAHSYGTVLDNTIGLAGIVEDVSGDTILVNAVSSNGVRVKATLEEGLPGLFGGVLKGHSVFCAVAVHERLGQSEVRGICFWLLDFGKIGLDFSNVLSAKESPWHEDLSSASRGRSPIGGGTRAAQRIASMLTSKVEVLPAVCVIAAVKASLSLEFRKMVLAFVGEGYFPVGFECSPARPGSSMTGYINVQFNFRNSDQDERSIVVPVKLSTWSAASGWIYAACDPKVREVDLLSCGFSCQRCRIECRVAQAACLAICPETGPAAVICAAVCYEVGNACYDDC